MSEIKPEDLNSQAVPFFARFLEGQNAEDISDEESEAISGGNLIVTQKYPSDNEEGVVVTKKCPSDNEHGGVATRKYPSDSDEHAVTKKCPSDNEHGGVAVTLKYPSDNEDGSGAVA
ncbi:MAG: microviridin/marinostatin family tricyclic proteinase inhibitor [Nostoc sp.]|uniref:microviridin/marinostatin family tricyclic proteinase inhibitor n=1 Tax=Nostoc sp. TaxID=1180 RepID=UPI002FF94C6B